MLVYRSIQQGDFCGVMFSINHHSPCLSSLFREVPASWNVVDTGAEVSMEEKVWPWSEVEFSQPAELKSISPADV